MSVVTYGNVIETAPRYENFKFEEVNDSITILFVELGEGVSEFGEFTTLCGVSFDPESATEEEAIQSIKLESFITQSVIQNLITAKKIVEGKVYQFTYTAPQGVKYVTKKGGEQRTKSKHYKVVEIVNIPPKLLQALQAAAQDSPAPTGLGLTAGHDLVEETPIEPVVSAAPVKARPAKPRL